MPVTDNVGLIYGRDSLGYPKKIADIAFYRQLGQVGGWVERHGVR
jgi:Acetoacetate decarboxylase (ADC)